jgi:exopolysaccharide biosynthesis protein
MNKYLLLFITAFFIQKVTAQLHWQLVDSVNSNLPTGVKLYYTNDSLDGKPNIAYYIEADLKNKNLIFDVDTTLQRRLTPDQYYEKNNKPLVVLNGTFFNFTTNQNLNVVIKNGKVVSHNIKSVQRKGADSILRNIEINRSAIGINKKGDADVAWIKTDTGNKFAMAAQNLYNKKDTTDTAKFKKWKMKTAIGGGPIVLQNGELYITNNEEKMFEGKGINDKHPRTAMGYTRDDKLIILVVQGRFANIADGATLKQEAQILKNIGCVEALNLDGGGSSCMLVNGKETIKPSDKTGQRATPAVFMIRYNKK